MKEHTRFKLLGIRTGARITKNEISKYCTDLLKVLKEKTYYPFVVCAIKKTAYYGRTINNYEQINNWSNQELETGTSGDML